MTIDFFSQLPPWPNYSPVDQMYWIEQLKVLLNKLDTQLESSLVYTVLLEQATEPSQGDWETAYEAQTPLSIPILPNTVLLWWDSANDRFGGLYGSLPNSDGQVFPRDNRYASGQIIAYGAAYKNDAVSVTSGISAVTLTQPSVSLSLSVPARLQLYYGLMTDLTAGSGNWGIDFAINGVKVGTLYFSIASNRGLAERANDGYLQIEVSTPILDPGDYTIQALFGVTNGSPTVQIGGNNGVRQLIVKAVAE